MGNINPRSIAYLLIGFSVGAVAMDVVEYDATILRTFWRELDQWQSLVGGALALLGALLTVLAILSQVGEQRRQVVEARRRSALSSRAVAAIALSKLSDYSKKAAEWAKLMKTTGGQEMEEFRGRLENALPGLPHDAVEALSRAVEYSEAEIGDSILALMVELQIQNARMRGEHEKARLWFEGDGEKEFARSAVAARQLLDAAKLHARVGALFSWARDKDPAMGLVSQRHHVSNSLSVLDVWPEDYEEVWNLYKLDFPEEDDGSAAEVREGGGAK